MKRPSNRSRGPQRLTAKEYLKAAIRRFEEAEILLRAEKRTGAVYLAGYSVECVLKALILAAISGEGARSSVEITFRGRSGHDLEILRENLVKYRKGKIPADVNHHFERVKTWSTDLRYETARLPLRDAVAFLEAAKKIIDWGERSMGHDKGTTRQDTGSVRHGYPTSSRIVSERPP